MEQSLKFAHADTNLRLVSRAFVEEFAHLLTVGK